MKFREGWTTIGSGVAEYQKVRYFGVLGWWIGLSIKWCEDERGVVTPSYFRHATGGTTPLHHWRLWYFHVTACHTGPHNKLMKKAAEERAKRSAVQHKPEQP